MSMVLENFIIVLLFIFVFAALYNLGGIKYVSNYHRERLLRIQHFGKSKIVNIIQGNKKLFTAKYFFNFFKSFKAHKDYVKSLIEKNHLEFKMNINDYMAIKYMVAISSVLAIIIIGFFDFKNYTNLLEMFITNINTLFSLFIFLAILFLGDIGLLNLLFVIKRNDIVDQLDFFTNLYELGIRSGETPIGALRTATAESSGFLQKEFETALQEYDSGLSFRHALNNMSDRVRIDELSTFIDFVKRASSNTHEDFSMFINHSRLEFINVKMQISKEQQNVLPQRLTYYNMMGFMAEIMIFMAPIIFAFLDSFNSSM